MGIIHYICIKCFYDLAEWGVPFGIDREGFDLVGWVGEDLHVYVLKYSNDRQFGARCDYDDHMYLANAR